MRRSIYSLVVLAASCLLWSCAGPRQVAEEQAESSPSVSVDPRAFDPIELAVDREVVPAKYPREGVITGRARLVDAAQEEASGSDRAAIRGDGLEPSTDSLTNQVFRVQLLTATVYGEARHAVRIAEEIFDRPVYVDYEVPYFKVRVGSFADRESAEQYQQKARAAGYTNAWVVMVTVNTKRAAPLYDEPEIQPSSEAGSTEDSVGHEKTTDE